MMLDETALEAARKAVKARAIFGPIADVSTLADTAIHAYLTSATSPDVAGLLDEAQDFAERMTGQPWACELVEKLSDALRLSAASLSGGWRPMESAPKDGTRILLAWKPFGGISEHVELGKWKARQGWSNTYGHPFNGEPDAWAPLPPASPTVEAGHVE